jgi:hypothetical protein
MKSQDQIGTPHIPAITGDVHTYFVACMLFLDSDLEA